MGTTLPELEPLAVRLSALLIPLMRLAGLVVVLGLIFAADAMVRAFFGTATGAVGWIPYAGRLLTSPLHKIEQKLTSYLGGLEVHIDASMGDFFHNLAVVTEQLASGQAEAAWATLVLSRLMHGRWHPAKTQAQIKHAQTTATHANAVATHAAREAHAHGGRLAQTAPGTLVPRVRGLEGALDHVLEWDIPRLRSRTRTVEKSLDNVWRKVRGLDKFLGAAAFTAAVAVALNRLGLKWLRCPGAQRLFNKRGCNAWNDIESLLVGAALIELPYTLELLAAVGREVIKDGSELIKEFR